MSKATLLQLAHPSKGDEFIINHFWSRKIDGVRGFWDGGITAGLPKDQVPWANTTKDDRYVDTQYATGLWSRYGHVIHAPRSFLDLFPPLVATDCELGCGRGSFQETTSIVKSLNKDDPRWDKVCARLFDLCSPQFIFSDRDIDDDARNYHVKLRGVDTWAKECGLKAFYGLTFEEEYKQLCAMFPVSDGWGDTSLRIAILKQHRLSCRNAEAWEQANALTAEEVSLGGEGGIVRHPAVFYQTERSHNLIKIKPYLDAEGVVIGWVAGKYGKEGKYLGMLGSLILSLDKGKTVAVSGFTDTERQLSSEQKTLAYQRPGLPVDGGTEVFPLGTRITFKYRELSKDGIPKEPRYFRKDTA